MSKKKKDLLTFRIITLGESGVGKTSLLRRYIDNVFDSKSMATIGLSFTLKEVTLKNNEKIQLKLIDTGGQEKYKALAKSYFKNADAVLFVYSKDNQKSFDNIKEWISLFKENHNGKEGIPQFLVESKGDLERVVDEDISIKFAEDNNLKFNKTSSKNDENSVNELFQEICELSYDNYIKYFKGSEQKKIRLKGYKNFKGYKCCIFKNYE